MTRFLLSTCAALLIGAAPVPAFAQSGAGAYLAGRQAASERNFSEAARYFSEALARDVDNASLLESTALAYLSLGQVDNALPIARRIEETGQDSQVAHLVVTAGLAAAGDFDTLAVRAGNPSGIGRYVDGMVQAWAMLGQGDTDAAISAFDTLAQEPGIESIVTYHKALALASVGEFARAEDILASDATGSAGASRRGAIFRASLLGALERPDEATALLAESFEGGTDPELDALIAQLESGDTEIASGVATARDGMAEVFFTFAAVLRSEQADDYFVLLYSRIARYLDPGHVDALLLNAGLLEQLGQQDLAIAEYKAIDPDSPAFHIAELGRAGALRRSDRTGQAIEVLEKLSQSHGDLPAVSSTLGDTLRAEENYAEAIAAYDRAIDLSEGSNRAVWTLFYARGIAHERLGNLDAMERDFRSALELNPDQPQVLNYLGYSLVEQKRNLDEALEMIERAVAASPSSGYIVDSLGWVLFRLGRYEDAVRHMERAVSLMATDPVVNDHLGDVYWAVGREREARFQWRRALSFVGTGNTSEEADPDRIRRKIDVGLDLVLEEEGAPPLRPVDGQ